MDFLLGLCFFELFGEDGEFMAKVLKLLGEKWEMSIDGCKPMLPNHSMFFDDLCWLSNWFYLILMDKMLMLMGILRKFMVELALISKCDIGPFVWTSWVKGTPIMLMLVGRRQRMWYPLINWGWGLRNCPLLYYLLHMIILSFSWRLLAPQLLKIFLLIACALWFVEGMWLCFIDYNFVLGWHGVSEEVGLSGWRRMWLITLVM